jgi:hypothetical protein
MFISFTNLNLVLFYCYYLVFTLHNDEFAWDELLLLRFYHYFYYFYIFRDRDPYARDPDVPPSPISLKFGGASTHFTAKN